MEGQVPPAHNPILSEVLATVIGTLLQWRGRIPEIQGFLEGLMNRFEFAARLLDRSIRRSAQASGFLALLTLLLAARPAESQSGLQGDYFNALSPPQPGTPGDFRRVDAQIDFTWLGDKPDSTTIVADDRYSERWTGFVKIDRAGTWKFITTSNDGVRLWVDNRQLIQNWTQHTAKDDSNTLAFTAPGWYAVRLEHFNDGGIAVIKLAFEGPGRARAIIPVTHLSVTFQGNSPPVVSAGPDRIVLPPARQVVLTGTATDPDGIKRTAWTQILGPAATIRSPGARTTTIDLAGPGLHAFKFEAEDNRGAKAADTVTVYGLDRRGGGSLSPGPWKKWHPLHVTFDRATNTSEIDQDNPFRNYRLDVYFVHPASGTVHRVPGYYAADGNAADTSASMGSKWRAHLTPDRSGTWFYLASFRQATDVNLSLDPTAGKSTAFDGANGDLTVSDADPNAPGFLRSGLLQYVGRHHLAFAETGRAFLKGGADSPENVLGYFEFDNTYDNGGLSTPGLVNGLHQFGPHVKHFNPTDPVDRRGQWKSTRGRGILGAFNYLASEGVNSVYFLTYNVDGGDGRDTWVWVSTPPNPPAGDQYYRFDVSKLAQWERVFSHMDARGLQLHVVTQETENDRVLDGGSLGPVRKLYYRELVARFAHHLAVIWNLGEENRNTDGDRKAFAAWIRTLDSYDHPITVHTMNNSASTFYNDLLGDANLDATSIQGAGASYNQWAIDLRRRSALAGRSWAIFGDEQGPAVARDMSNVDRLRREALWGNLSGGGAGVEWYFGYQGTFGDVQSEDWTVAAPLWKATRNALAFFRTHLPFDDMKPENSLVQPTGAYCLRQPGEVHAVFLPTGGTSSLDVGTSSSRFTVRWYDPRVGGGLLTGSVTTVVGPGWVSLGAPPRDPARDWAILVLRDNQPPHIDAAIVSPDPFPGNTTLWVGVLASDPDGLADIASVVVFVFAPDLSYLGYLPLAPVGGGVYLLTIQNLPSLPSGTWRLVPAVFDRRQANHGVVLPLQSP